MSFPKKLKELRKEKKWTQDELGEKIGVHGRHVGKYEKGKVMPNTETLIKIAKIFEVSVDYLLFESNDPRLIELQDKELLKYFQEVSNMERKDKEVIKSLVDAYIKKRQLEVIMAK